MGKIAGHSSESLEWPGKERTEEGRRLTMNGENLIGGKGRLGSTNLPEATPESLGFYRRQSAKM